MQVSRDVAELARTLRPRGAVAHSSFYSDQVWKDWQAKSLVASYVAHELIHAGTDVFIADGSSALWLVVAILEMDLEVHIRTNNLPAANEKLAWPQRHADVTLAPGKVNGHKAAIFGPEAEDWSADWALKSQRSILPVSFLTFKEGPWAATSDARRMKRRVFPVAWRPVIIADSTKLGQPSKEVKRRSGPVFIGHEDQRTWEAIRAGEETIFVCDWPVNRPAEFVAEVNEFRHDDSGGRFRVLEWPATLSSEPLGVAER